LQVNCNEYVECYFAVAKIGAIFVPLNFRAKQKELTHMLNDSESKVLLSGERYIKMVQSMKDDLTSQPRLVSLDGKVEGMDYYEDVLAAASPDEVFTDIGDDDVTILMYTAGTTGLPKGVPLKHSAFSGYVLGNVHPGRSRPQRDQHPDRSPVPCSWHSGHDGGHLWWAHNCRDAPV